MNYQIIAYAQDTGFNTGSTLGFLHDYFGRVAGASSVMVGIDSSQFSKYELKMMAALVPAEETTSGDLVGGVKNAAERLTKIIPIRCIELYEGLETPHLCGSYADGQWKD